MLLCVVSLTLYPILIPLLLSALVCVAIGVAMDYPQPVVKILVPLAGAVANSDKVAGLRMGSNKFVNLGHNGFGKVVFVFVCVLGRKLLLGKGRVEAFEKLADAVQALGCGWVRVHNFI